jgi:hypothetical protein
MIYNRCLTHLFSFESLEHRKQIRSVTLLTHGVGYYDDFICHLRTLIRSGEVTTLDQALAINSQYFKLGIPLTENPHAAQESEAAPSATTGRNLVLDSSRRQRSSRAAEHPTIVRRSHVEVSRK